MREKGTLKVKEDKKKKPYAEIDLGKKQPMRIPDGFEIDFAKIDGKDAEVERENGQIVKLFIDGQEITKKSYKPPAKQQPSYQKSLPQQRFQNQSRTQPQQPHIQSNNREENNMPDSVNINNTQLPSDTRSLNFTGIDNFALKLNKSARFDENTQNYTKSKFKFFETNKGKVVFQIQPNYGNLDFKQLNEKMSTIKFSLESQGYKITDPISMKPDWRLIVGLGNESVYETSITLHHIYGIPYIPGSAIKGVTRSYVIQQIVIPANLKDRLDIIDKLFEIDSAEFKKIIEEKDTSKLKNLIKVKDSEKKDVYPSEDLLNKVLENNWDDLKQARKIFGNQNDQGHITFFDAFPTSPPKIEPDIMNPHYGPYYEDKSKQTPPADYHDPRPLFFLTVKDAEFDFYLGMKPKHYNCNGGTDLFKFAENRLKKALTEHGIGAKTAVGYGYFKTD